MEYDKVESALRFLIRNYAVNSASSFEDLFETNESIPKAFRRAHTRFKCDYQFYVNRYMALSYIYYSLINIGSLYSSMVFLHENKTFDLNSGKEESNFFIAANEPFGHQVIMQYAKLYEALVDLGALNNDSDLFNKKDKKHAAKLLDNNKLISGYSYLSALRKKIELSGVLQLRNTIFAHPFKDGEAGSVVFLEYISDKIFSIFRELCDEKDKRKYDDSSNRIRFYCNNYIMSASYDFKGGMKGEFRIKTKAQTHIKAIYDFMSILRNEKLLGEEPLLMVDTKNARFELGEILAKL